MSTLDELIELLACPICEDRPALRREGGEILACTACERRYPIVDGIPHLLPESALEATS